MLQAMGISPSLMEPTISSWKRPQPPHKAVDPFSLRLLLLAHNALENLPNTQRTVR